MPLTSYITLTFLIFIVTAYFGLSKPNQTLKIISFIFFLIWVFLIAALVVTAPNM